jgi:hypothetical protein
MLTPFAAAGAGVQPEGSSAHRCFLADHVAAGGTRVNLPSTIVAKMNLRSSRSILLRDHLVLICEIDPPSRLSLDHGGGRVFGGADARRRAAKSRAPLPGGNSMRVMGLVITAIIAVVIAQGEALAAKRSAATSNPDRQYYQGAGSCGGAAYCYRSGSQKNQKVHKTAKSN